MTTRATFDLETDNEELRQAVTAIDTDEVMKWRIAVFVCQQQLEKAIKLQAIREHYDTIHMRARATREAKRNG